jgi:hypothetical protein
VNHCRSSLQGCQSPSPTAAPEDSDPEDALALKAATEGEKLNSVPSISAPITKRSGRVESPPTPQGGSAAEAVSPIELRASASSTPKRRTADGPEDLLDKNEAPKKAKTESVDADTNTVSTGKPPRAANVDLLRDEPSPDVLATPDARPCASVSACACACACAPSSSSSGSCFKTDEVPYPPPYPLANLPPCPRPAITTRRRSGKCNPTKRTKERNNSRNLTYRGQNSL